MVVVHSSSSSSSSIVEYLCLCVSSCTVLWLFYILRNSEVTMQDLIQLIECDQCARNTTDPKKMTVNCKCFSYSAVDCFLALCMKLLTDV